MYSRKTFLKQAAFATAGLSLLDWMEPVQAAAWEKQLTRIEPMSPAAVAEDEDFWNWVREQYTTSPNLVNLNNGGVSPQPVPVQEAHIRNYKMCNEAPSYFMWRVLDQGREPMRAKLADLAGCSPEEIAINRNSTEGLNTIIFGLNLKAGDEVVVGKYDYPNMTNAYKQREMRDGIKINWVELDMPMDNEKEIVRRYETAITSKTKVVHITHMVNYTGQILPCRKIADMAHAKGCEVVVDGAHTFAHTVYNIPDLGCDYFATSLHKWLCAPFGTGLMYVRKDKIKDVWALLSNNHPKGEDIRKFESIGTRSNAAEMAIANAVDFHWLVGSKRKEERLRFLKNYWCEKVIKHPKVKLYTSLKSDYSCALATMGIEGWEAGDIESRLFEKRKIIVVGIKHEKVNGIRVTPHLYTSLRDLDRLVEGILEMANMEAPKKT